MIVWLATVDEERDYGSSATRLIGVFFTAQAACSAAEQHWTATEHKGYKDKCRSLYWKLRNETYYADARSLDEYLVSPEWVR